MPNPGARNGTEDDTHRRADEKTSREGRCHLRKSTAALDAAFDPGQTVEATSDWRLGSLPPRSARQRERRNNFLLTGRLRQGFGDGTSPPEKAARRRNADLAQRAGGTIPSPTASVSL
jgi:hypothetical protein